MFQAPAHLTKAHHLFDCISFTVYRSPYCHTVLNSDGRVHTVTYLRLFYLFPHTSFYTFSHLHILFFSPSSGSFLFFFFFIAIFLYSHLFHVCFSFHSSQSLPNFRLLTTHIPRYSPIVVVIMRIMSTLGRCPLKVISSKISVFLSIDS